MTAVPGGDRSVLFRSLVEQLPIAVYVDRLDELSSPVYLSPQIEELTGYAPDEFERDPELYLRLVHPDDRARYLELVARRNRESLPTVAEYRLIARNGRLVWVLDGERVLLDQHGTAVYAQGYLLDVTEERSHRVRLEALDAVLGAFSSGAPPDEIVRRALGSLARSLGQVRASFVAVERGHRVRILDTVSDGTMPALPREVVDLTEAPSFFAALERGEPVSSSSGPRSDQFGPVFAGIGGSVPAAFVDVPVWHAGRLLGVLSIDSPIPRDFTPQEVQSLTEVGRQLAAVLLREGAEVDLRRRDEILSTVSRAAASLLGGSGWEETAPGLVESLGRAAGAGRAYVFQLVPGEPGRVVASQRYEWVADGVSRQIDNPQLQGIDLEEAGLEAMVGSLRRNEVFAAHVRDLPSAARAVLDPQSIVSLLTVPVLIDGEPWGLIGLDECTEEREWSAAETDALRAASSLLAAAIERERSEDAQRELELRLHAAQRLESLGRMAGAVAHDFNNLLTAIGGYTALAVERAGDDDALRDDLHEIGRATERAAGLTRQLLAFGRRQVLQPRTIRIEEVVDGVAPMLRRLLGGDVALDIQLDPDAGAVFADPGQLEQVVVNLAVNGRDAMPDGGTLTITSRVAERYGRTLVELAVADSGTGMEVDTRARVFEPFFTTRPDGVGLGLATVYGIVTQSGGEVEVRSEPGHGSTFTVLLPRTDAPALAEPPVVPEAPPHGSETVLLVDDEDVVRTLTRRVLERHGYHVLESASGADALRLAAEHDGEIHVLLTDVGMPGLRGHEVAERVAAARPGIRVVYMSGYADDTLLDLAADGRSHVLEKPFSGDTLARRIREALGAGGPDPG